ASEAADADRLCVPERAGYFGTHQAFCRAGRLDRTGNTLRPAAAIARRRTGRGHTLPLEWMAPLMFGALIVFMLIGFPVAFSLSAVGLFFAFISIEEGFFTLQYLQNLPLSIFGIMSNDLLLAIPFFTFMGAILERCGLAEDLLEGTGQLFG